MDALRRETASETQRADEQALLLRFTDRLFRAGSMEGVFDAALDAICQVLQCRRASILMFDAAGVMQFVAVRGLSVGYQSAVTGHTPWSPGEADATPITIADIEATSESEALKATIRAEGIAALMFVPICQNGRVIGKFMAYHETPRVFGARETDIALAIARQLGFAIERDRAREFRKGAEEELRASKDRLDALFERSGVGMVLMGRDYVIDRANAVFAQIFGKDAHSLAGASCAALMRPDDAVEDEGAPGAFEKRFRRADGAEVWARVTLSSISEDLLLGVVEDVTARRAAEAAQRQLISIVENSDDAIISKDLNGIIVSWNQGAESLFGWQAHEIVGKSVLTLIPPEYQSEEPTILERIRRGERIHHYETIRRRKDGEHIHISLTVSPVKDATGRIVGASKIARDITERKHNDAQRTLLIHELNHRVKNTLATVQSLAMQTLRTTERSDQARALLDARLTALARAHDILTAENWEGADLDEVVQRALEAFRAANTRVEARGPGVRLTPKQALALSLALHELATNAAKYGALSGEQGRVELHWRIDQSESGARLTLRWTESGGPPVTPPLRQGFGSRLIQRSLAHELDGDVTISYDPTGVVAIISAPIELSTVLEAAQ